MNLSNVFLVLIIIIITIIIIINYSTQCRLNYRKTTNMKVNLPRVCYVSIVACGRILTFHSRTIPVITRSKTWVYSRSLAVIASSNPAGGMDNPLL